MQSQLASQPDVLMEVGGIALCEIESLAVQEGQLKHMLIMPLTRLIQKGVCLH